MFKPLSSLNLLGAAVGISLALLCGGCERGAQPVRKPPASAALPAELFLAAEPTDALSVRAAKEQAKEGVEFAVRGRIGGRRDPFVAGTAIFLLVDKSVPMCSDHPGDRCPTPWDYCCEDRQSILAATATVQLVGADGRPLPIDVRGKAGLEPGAEVVVVGTKAKAEDGSTLVINARGIYVPKR